MLDITLPTPERMAMGDLDLYTTNTGEERAERKKGTDYHDLLYQAERLTAAQHLACKNILWLHHEAGGKHRTILGVLVPSTGYTGWTDQERKFDAGYRYRFVMNAMARYQREVILYKLIHGATHEQAARAAHIGKGRVCESFIEGAQKMADAFYVLHQLETEQTKVL